MIFFHLLDKKQNTYTAWAFDLFYVKSFQSGHPEVAGSNPAGDDAWYFFPSGESNPGHRGESAES